ncbi:serine/threonine-protein kinase ATM isoform X2 [Hermetia illucens]|nr:serine/threonine-protein kinase ATM isoform X2 [Hermetia illucens]
MTSSQSVRLSALHSELQQLCIEIRSDSQPSRNKAVESLNSVLSNRKSDIIDCITNPEYGSSLNWSTLFNNAFEGIIKHSVKLEESKNSRSFSTLNNKNPVFAAVVSKIIEYAIEAKSPLKCGLLIEAVTTGLENQIVYDHFGTLLFRIIDTGFIVVGGNLAGVKLSDLTNLLRQCFTSYDERSSSGQILSLLRCLNQILSLGTEYTPLCIELPQFLGSMKTICQAITSDKSTQYEVIKLVYQFVCNVVVDRHMEIAHFLQAIMPSLCEYYDFRMKMPVKEQFFELCAIFLSIHYVETGNFEAAVPILNEDEWKNQLKQIFNLVKLEIKEKSRELNKDTADTYCQSFLLLAPIASYMIFWNPLFESTSGETQRKIPKYATKYQGLLDLTSIDSSKLNWGWFIILSECMVRYHYLIDITDYQPMLELVVRFQKAATSTSQIRSVGKYCSVLLEKGVYFEGNTFLNINYCASQWRTVVDTAINNLLQKSLTSEEHHSLVQTLIKYQKIPNDSLLSLVKSLITNTKFRTNRCLLTVRTIMKYYREIFLSNAEVVRDLIVWLNPLNVRLDVVSKINNKSTDPKLMADIIAYLIVENDNPNNEAIKSDENDAQTRHFGTVQKAIHYGCLKKVIFIESRRYRPAKNEQTTANQWKLIVNEKYFKILLHAIDFDPRTITQQDASDLMNNMSKLETLLTLLSNLLDRGKFDNNDLCLSAVIKKAGFLLNTIEMQLKDDNIRNMDISNARDVLDQLGSIVDNLQNPIISNLVSSNNSYSIIEYLSKCLNWFGDYDVMLDTDDTIFRRNLALKCIKVLASCRTSSSSFSCINNFEVDLHEEKEVQAILSIIGVFCDHEQQPHIAKWIMENVQDICKQHHSNLKLSLSLIKLLPNIANYVKPYENFTEAIMVILSSFLKMSYKKIYPPRFVAELLKTVRNIAKIYYELVDNEEFSKIFVSVNKFLTMPSKYIQYAAVDCWSYLIDDKWLYENTEKIPFRHLSLCNTMFDAINCEEFGKQNQFYERQYPVIIQLLLAAFGLSCNLEEQALLLLMMHGFLTSKDSSHSLQEIGKYLERDLEMILKQNLIAVAIEWFESILQRGGNLVNSPWAPFVRDEMKFLEENRKVIEFCALYANYDMVRKLSNRLGSSLQRELEQLKPLITATLLPRICEHNTDIKLHNCDSEQLIENMKKYKLNANLAMVNSDSAWEVLYFLSKNVWDQEKFNELCGFEMMWPKPNMINYDTFVKYVKYFLYNKITKGTSIIDSLMKHKSLQVVYLLNAIKADFENSYYVEMKLFAFFHYCLTIHCIVSSLTNEFQKDKMRKVKEFLIRDAIHYLCNILKNAQEDILMLQAATHFLIWFSSSLLPNNKISVEENLNLLVRSFMSLISKDLSVELTDRCFDTLDLLINRNCDLLSESIAVLDDFPTEDRYNNFRLTQEKIKYRHQTNSLWDEINYFLKCSDRGVAGFQNLRKHLANRKNELISMCNFANKTIEMIRSSPIFKLLKLLLTSVKNKNDDIKVEAAKCLGELGPVNLTTVSLFSDLKNTCYEKFETSEESFQYFISKVMESLEDLLLTGKHTKVRLANEICHQIVNSKVGKECLASTPLFQIFGQTFDHGLEAWKTIKDIPFSEILESTKGLTYSTWITEFTSRIYGGIDYKPFQKLSALDGDLCEQTYTAFFKLLLSTNNKVHLSSIEKLVKKFFEATNIALKDPCHTLHAQVNTDKSTIKYFLNITECIRLYNQTSDCKLNINYLHVAKACIHCEAYFMAVLCLEMWALSEQSPLENDDFQLIAKEAFTSIGYLDALSGFLDPMNSRLDYLSVENQWEAMLVELDAGPSTNDNTSMYETCLRQCGFYSLAGNVESSEQDYEILWRLGNWNITQNDPKQREFDGQNYRENNFEFYHYHALRSIKRMEEQNAKFAAESARNVVIEILKLVSSECAQNIYKYITWLQMIQQIDDFCLLQFPNQNVPSNILQKWDQTSKMEYGHFEHKELSLSQKIALFNMAGIRAQRKIEDSYKGNIVGEHLLNLIMECKLAGNKNLVIRNITRLRNMDIKPELKTKVLIEDADINWKMGNTSMAKSILHHIIKTEAYACCFKKVDALRIYGEYHAESNSESFEIIYKKFFKISSKLLDNFTAKKDDIAKTLPSVLKDYEQYNHSSRKNIHRSIAKYADREYSQLNDYINSEDFQVKIRVMGRNQNDAKAIRDAKRYKTNRDELITLNLLAQNAGIDDYEIKAVEGRKIEYLCLAIENYMQYCILDEEVKSMEIFRIISLWFSNTNVTEVSQKIKDFIEIIPSYKFICVLNQITARLSGVDVDLDNILQKLLVTCSIEHPHHTLPYILAISHANMDSKSASVQNVRVEAANIIVDEISKNDETSELLYQMRTTSKALIDFANKDSKDCVHNTLSDALRRMKDIRIQCHTLELPISPNKEYIITSISKWKDKFTSVGGINAPKKIICICTDGIARPQLLKGKDDLRQDAIMQQIFGIVNDVLSRDRDARKRKLNIRTYKVVPLSMRSGILEWCENTIPLGLYLTGEKKNSGAHKKFRPQDYAPDECYKKLLEKHKSEPTERYKRYQEVCERFKPVFHHFFFEHFLNPEMWFEKRLAYTNSVATTSIVGYILGLGDRHVQNILIDQITAEVIHIDFGIAFEQGKVMPTPETVPFRLTRDIVAPFGVCKVDGIFRKSCEKTMTVLRENQAVLLTVLEVLLYDPLYIWIVKQIDKDSEKVERVKSIGEEEKNCTAQRALIRVKAKLMGMEEVGAGITSVEGQVQRLIKQAMDPRNLSQLFPGWNPHL